MDLQTHKRHRELKASLLKRISSESDFTREEAEKLAIEGGLKSLFKKPDPNDFDPMLEEDWTFLMVMAWAMWRTPAAVRSHSAQYAEFAWHFEPNAQGGFDIEESSRITLEDLYAAESLSSIEHHEVLTDDAVEPLVLRYNAAYAELRAAVIRTDLTFQAVEFASGEVVRSSDVLLSGFEIKPLKNDDIAVRVRESAKYGDPIFRKSDVLRFWPPLKAGSNGPLEGHVMLNGLGRPPNQERPGIDDWIRAELTQHGMPGPECKKYKTQAAFIRAVGKLIVDNGGEEENFQTTKTYVRGFFDELFPDRRKRGDT